MNYTRIYNSIIENRRNIPYIGYTEKHHIIPASLCGSDDKTNIVRLSAKEHFVCHHLLVEIHKNNKFNRAKMIKAFMCMIWRKSDNQYRYLTSREFSKLREEFSKNQSINQSGECNSQYGTRWSWIHNDVTREKRKISFGSTLPVGWEYGLTFDLHLQQIEKKFANKIKKNKILYIHNDLTREIKTMPLNNEIPKGWVLGKNFDVHLMSLERARIKQIEKNLIEKNKIELLTQYHEIYKKEGFEKFVEITGYDKSQPNLVTAFKKNIIDFVPQNGKNRIDNSSKVQERKLERRELNKDKKRAENIILFNKYYDIYTSIGFESFVKLTGFDKPKASLTMSFMYYVEGYKKVV